MTAARGRLASGTRGRLASVALSLAVVGGAAAPVVILAPAAAAHSVLLSVDPQDGAALDAAPDRVTLTFNEDINQSFATVAVTSDADRTNRVAGEPAVDGGTVTASVEDLPAGAYTVGYRVTSADGHVISGSSGFTVGPAGGETAAAPSGESAAASSAAPGDSEAASDGPDAASDSAEAPASDESAGIDPALWVVGGLAVLLIGGAFFLLRRGK